MNSAYKLLSLIFLIFLIGCSQGQKVKQTKVELSEIKDHTTIIFDRDSTRIYFGKNELMKYCEKTVKKHAYERKTYNIKTAKGDTAFSPAWDASDTIFFRGDTIDISHRIFKNAFYKLKDTMMSITVSMDTIVDGDTELLSFLQKLKDTTVVIKDSMVTKLETVPKALMGDTGRGDTTRLIYDYSFSQTAYSATIEWAMIDILRAGKGKVFDVRENKFVDYIIIKDLEDDLSGDVEMYLPNGKIFYHAMLWIH